MIERKTDVSHEGSTSILRLLGEHHACPEAVEWAADKQSFQMMWEACQEPEWILWSFEQLDYRDDAKLRLFAVACARRHKQLFSDDRADAVLEIAEAVAKGKAEKAELWTAWSDGRAAADHAASLPTWSMARAAAMSAACDSARMDAMEAAKRASRNALRASVWNIEPHESNLIEAQWQAQTLRRLFDDDLSTIVGRARKALSDSVR